MSETVTPTPENVESPVAETVTASRPTKESNEVFLGGVIIVVLCVLLLLLTGTFGYFGYRLWQASHIERSTPSIQELGEKITETPETSSPSESTISTPTPTPVAPTTTETSPVDKATVEVIVLNGGGARGSASTLVELLKKAGYAKAAFGNTVADYTGTTVYHAADAVKAAELIKEEVIKTYPKVTLAPAKVGDKDMTAASVVVILGKE